MHKAGDRKKGKEGKRQWREKGKGMSAVYAENDWVEPVGVGVGVGRRNWMIVEGGGGADAGTPRHRNRSKRIGVTMRRTRQGNTLHLLVEALGLLLLLHRRRRRGLTLALRRCNRNRRFHKIQVKTGTWLILLISALDFFVFL